jgi:peroxiredoxin
MAIISELFDDAKFIIKIRGKLMKRQIGFNKLAPKAGDVAPDFTLYDISGMESITLSDFRGKKPVALVFGSYT